MPEPRWTNVWLFTLAAGTRYLLDPQDAVEFVKGHENAGGSITSKVAHNGDLVMHAKGLEVWVRVRS